jgi:phage regulator Rha-like protein
MNAIVSIHQQQAFTTSLAVAEGCELAHKNTLALIRKFQGDFEELGPLAFETPVVGRKQGGGTPIEYALLSEDQATYLITLFRNTPVVRKFKLRLVKEFRRAINEISRLYANPPRQSLLEAKRHANSPMMEALVEFRAELGKATEAKHFMCEAKLCNWAVTGQFEAIDEKVLTNEDAILLEKIRHQNRAMIDQGLSYDERKKALNAFAIRKRTRLITRNQLPFSEDPSQ